jgi:hypothetical protein
MIVDALGAGCIDDYCDKPLAEISLIVEVIEEKRRSEK